MTETPTRVATHARAEQTFDTLAAPPLREDQLRRIADLALRLTDADSARVTLTGDAAVTVGDDSHERRTLDVPLVSPEGVVLGELSVGTAAVRGWSEDDRAGLAQLAEVAASLTIHGARERSVHEVMVLAERLTEPVARLGDSVRTAAGLAEDPGDPRLPRVADVALERLDGVEALAQDLASVTGVERPSGPVEVDVRAMLDRASAIAGAFVGTGEVVLLVPDRPVTVLAVPAVLHRSLALALSQLLLHVGEGGEVTARLDAEPHAVSLTLTGDVTLPAADVLRIAGHFGALRDEAPALHAAYDGGAVRAGNDAVEVETAEGHTRIEVRLTSSR